MTKSRKLYWQNINRKDLKLQNQNTGNLNFRLSYTLSSILFKKAYFYPMVNNVEVNTLEKIYSLTFTTF